MQERRRRGSHLREQSNISPHEPFEQQRTFLAIAEVEALYGGALGGGKTDCLLMDFLQHAHIPGYTGCVIRRVSPSLSGPGGAADRAKSWFPSFWSEGKQALVIPTHDPSKPSRLFFRHCQFEKDKYAFQGLELDWLGVDEAQEFTHTQYSYVKTRVRGSGSGGPIKIRCTANPGQHRWVREYFVEPGDPSRPFISSKLDDNPYLEKEVYEEILKGLDDTTYQQLRLGKWIEDTNGLIYPVTANNRVDRIDINSMTHQVIGLDLGASLRDETTAYTSLLWSSDQPFATYVHRSLTFKVQSTSEIDETVQSLIVDKDLDVTLVVDPGGLGQHVTKTLRQRNLLGDYRVEEAQKSEKARWRRLLRDDINDGSAKILYPECSELYDECIMLQYNEQGTDNMPGQPDHRTDAWLYAWRYSRAYLSEAPRKPETDEERALRLEREAKRMEISGGNWI